MPFPTCLLRAGALLSVVSVSALAAPQAAAKDLAVVVHKANSTKGLAAAELSKIMKNGTRKWRDGREILLVIREPDSPEMKLVVQKVYGSNANEVKALLANMNQARKGSVLLVNDNDALVKAVETNPGALGIVDLFSITSGVSVLKIDGKLPAEPGYLLHGN